MSVQIDYIEPTIAQIRMEDKVGKNCLTHAFVAELTEKIETLSHNEAIKVIVLTGLSDVFSAGADLETLKQLCTGEMKPVDILLPKILLNVPIPMIAAMEGHAIGGGLALGLCADIVLLAEESRYGCSFMNMGFTPGMGITHLLEHFMSPAIAHEMQYTGTSQKGKALKGKTNFNNILPKGEVLPKAIQIAQAIDEKPRKALTVLKRCLSVKRRKAFEESFVMESMMHDLTFNQKDILKHIEENYVR